MKGVKREVETQTAQQVRLTAANKRIVAAQQALETATVNVSAAQKPRHGRHHDVLFALAQRNRPSVIGLPNNSVSWRGWS